MGRNLCLACGLLLALTPALRADALFGGGQRAHMRAISMAMERHNFAIERDPAATRAKLIVPTSVYPAWTAVDATPRGRLPMGIALGCCVGVGGLWLSRSPRRLLLGGFLPLVLAVMITPAQANMPIANSKFNFAVPPFEGTALYSGQIDVYVAQEGDHVQLILPGAQLTPFGPIHRP